MIPTDSALRAALDLLGELDRAGFTLAVRGDALIVAPGSKLTDTQRQRLRCLKPALLWLLARLPSPAAQAALDAADHRSDAHAPPPDFDGPCVVSRAVIDLGDGDRRVIGGLNEEADDALRAAAAYWNAHPKKGGPGCLACPADPVTEEDA